MSKPVVFDNKPAAVNLKAGQEYHFCRSSNQPFCDGSHVGSGLAPQEITAKESGGIPVGFKLCANHIEREIQFALDAGADYVIQDERGSGTGAK